MGLSLLDSFKNFVARYPTPNSVPGANQAPNRSTWANWCALGQALWNRRGDGLGWSREGDDNWGPGAKHVGYASRPLNGNPSAAPRGAWHFWSNGRYGHVGRDLTGGGVNVGMFGTSHLRETLRAYCGITSVKQYSDAVGGYYMGWATNYGGRTASALEAPSGAPSPAPAGSSNTFRKASAEAGAPYWPVGPLMKRIQRALKNRGRYNGLVDGIPGELTAKGIQTTLNISGTFGGIKMGPKAKGKVDGKLGSGAAWGVQEYARAFGDYKGAQDGDPRVNSWAGFALGLERP